MTRVQSVCGRAILNQQELCNMRRRAVMTSLISVDDDGGGENWHDAGGSVRVSGGGGVYFFLPSEPKRDFRSPFSAEAVAPPEAGSVWARAPGVNVPAVGSM